MLFDAAPAELPTATLVHGTGDARHRVLQSQLRHWLAARWSWIRPRTVPLVAAFAGMIALLGTTHYLSTLSIPPPGMYEPPTLAAHGHRDHVRIVPLRPGTVTVRFDR